mgnify:CR=1 FL=1
MRTESKYANYYQYNHTHAYTHAYEHGLAAGLRRAVLLAARTAELGNDEAEGAADGQQQHGHVDFVLEGPVEKAPERQEHGGHCAAGSKQRAGMRRVG